MKKAFTLLELVVVIVVIGVLASVAMPRFDRNNLQLAADQILSHIRYTQHLAMVDDKFVPTDANWYKKRWIFEITNINTKDKVSGVCENVNCWRYNVYNDIAGNSTNNLNSIVEAATDPLDPSKKLTSGFSPTSMSKSDLKQLNLKLNLTHTYKITDIQMSDGCQANKNTGNKVRFDELGRPYYGNTNSPYSSYGACTIKLLSGSDCVKIKIETRTGYSYIDTSDASCKL